MKKILLLGLLLTSMAACSGVKGKKIKDVANMTMEDISKVAKTLTPEQMRKMGDAVGRCKVDPDAEICNETIKEVTK